VFNNSQMLINPDEDSNFMLDDSSESSDEEGIVEERKEISQMGYREVDIS